MTTSEFLAHLESHPDHGISIVLPDTSTVPAHFHVTEVGHVTKSFIDCGGKRHTNASCVLQTWIADDTDHRLVSSKLLRIFSRAEGLLPSTDLPVEIEHEAPVLTQLPITRCEIADSHLRFYTEFKKTDCLAKDLCLPDFSLPPLPGMNKLCTPGSGCC